MNLNSTHQLFHDGPVSGVIASILKVSGELPAEPSFVTKMSIIFDNVGALLLTQFMSQLRYWLPDNPFGASTTIKSELEVPLDGVVCRLELALRIGMQLPDFYVQQIKAALEAVAERVKPDIIDVILGRDVQVLALAG